MRASETVLASYQVTSVITLIAVTTVLKVRTCMATIPTNNFVTELTIEHLKTIHTVITAFHCLAIKTALGESGIVDEIAIFDVPNMIGNSPNFQSLA